MKIIHRAIDLGINFIDTSPIYGKGYSEVFIKNAIRSFPRNKIILSTKAGLEPVVRKDRSFGVSVPLLNKEYLSKNIENSLKTFGTDYIDLFQIHAFDPNTPLEETIGTLDNFINDGKIRFIGCSNYDHTQLKLALKVSSRYKFNKFVSFQIHYNLLERRAEDNIIPICEKEGLTMIINRALARGILTGKYKFGKPLPEDSRAKRSNRVKRWLEKDTLNAVEELDNFSRRLGHSVTELSNSWLLSRYSNILVLAGARNIKQLETVVNSINWKLSEEHVFEIDKIIKRYNLEFKVRKRPETFCEK